MLPIQITSTLHHSKKEWLQNRWQQLAEISNIEKEKTDNLFQIICSHYQEKHRAYHNLSHIWSLFQIYDSFYQQKTNTENIEYTIWFHDIIYNPASKKNETNSALFFEKTLTNYLSEKDICTISTIIKSTAKHLPLIESEINKQFLDFDLAILAAPTALYETYTKAIRKEYNIYPSFLYKKGRKKVLQHFLKRERIYFSSLFYEKFETNARENIKKELKLF